MDILTFVISLIGALAWIPDIWEWFQKGKINIHLDENVEIMSNQFYSLVCLRVVLETLNTDIFIKNMTLEVKHESGKSNTYKWQGVLENISNTKVNGIYMPTDKFYRGIGFKTYKNQIASVGINFYHEELRKIYNELSPKLFDLKFKHGRSKIPLRQIELHPDFIALTDAYKKYLFWDAGRYDCTMKIETDDKAFQKEFSMSMSNHNAESIKEFNTKVVIDNFLDAYARDKDDFEATDPDNAVNLPIYLILNEK